MRYLLVVVASLAALSVAENLQLFEASDISLNVDGEIDLDSLLLDMDDDEKSDSNLLQERMHRQGNITVVSLAIYYTRGFAFYLRRPDLAIRNLVRVVNLSYYYSKIPVRVRIHCVRKALSVSERTSNSSAARLAAFKAIRDNVTQLLNSADVAVLLTRRYVNENGTRVCGGVDAIEPSMVNGADPVLWATPFCPGLTLARQLGHIFGARNNREVDNSTDYGHGYLIPNSRFYTVMALPNPATRHTRPVIYYSGNLTMGRFQLGDENNDVRRKIADTRFTVASQGDESDECCSDHPRYIRHCIFWQQRGYCQRSGFVRRNCRDSCDLC